MFDVLLDDRKRRSAAGGREVARAPEDALVVAPDEIGELLPEQPRRDALEGIHEIGDRHMRRVLDQEMNVVVLAVHLGKHRPEVPAHVLEDASHSFDVLRREDMLSILRDED